MKIIMAFLAALQVACVIVALTILVMLLTACGGGGDSQEEQTTPPTGEYRLNVLPWTSSYQGNIEVCAPVWYAPRNMVITASLDYAPNMTVYINYRAVDSLPVRVYKDDSVYVCATMPSPITIYSGTVTIKEIPLQ